MVLRVCKKPAFIDINSSAVVLHLLPLILLGHLCNAFWTYGNHEIFPNEYEPALTLIDGQVDTVYVAKSVPFYLRPITI